MLWQVWSIDEVWKNDKSGPSKFGRSTLLVLGPFLILKLIRTLIINPKPNTNTPAHQSSPTNKPGPLIFKQVKRSTPAQNPHHCSSSPKPPQSPYQGGILATFHPPPHHSTHPLRPPPLCL